MSDPKLKSCSVRITYSATDGYRSEVGFGSNRASSPHAALLDAIDELARVLALFGFADEACTAVAQACNRVNADRSPAPEVRNYADRIDAANPLETV